MTLVAADLLGLPTTELTAAARKVRDRAVGTRVTYSPKVFIPLTMLCRDRCGYCTFAKPPARLASPYLALDEVLAIARAGAARPAATRPCSPWASGPRSATRRPPGGWPTAATPRPWTTWPRPAGRCSTRPGSSPTPTPGPSTQDELAALRPVTASQGMMIETLAAGLAAHRGRPTRRPSGAWPPWRRPAQLAIPFTTGILVGIGETGPTGSRRWWPSPTSHRRHGHVQEVIVQNFLPKPGTAMAGHPPCPAEELLWSIAAARLLLPPDVHVQAPPNLSDDLGPAARRRASTTGAACRR